MTFICYYCCPVKVIIISTCPVPCELGEFFIDKSSTFISTKSTFLKISFPYTLYIYALLKTKERPRMNQGTTKELPNIKSAFY